MQSEHPLGESAAGLRSTRSTSVRDWEFVELLREYVRVNRTLRSMFHRFRDGAPCFAEVAQLVGDSETSILFRLKERCHALFRNDPTDASDLHREVLFDLTVGSLFHEAMKLRENLYQHEVYVPKVERLFEQHGPDDSAFFKEFERVQSTGYDRTQQAMRETEALLGQTRNQLRALLVSHAENTLMTRNLFENRDAVEFVFESDLCELFGEIHGSAAVGFAAAADSYLESAFFVEAMGCLDSALAESSLSSKTRYALTRSRKYAEGMEHFSNAAYAQSLDSLEAWLDADFECAEVPHMRFADSALSRFGNLVGDDEDGSALRARAEQVIKRIETMLPDEEPC